MRWRTGWLLLLPLIVPATNAQAARIPDSSVVPTWTETLTTVVDLAKNDFPGFTAAATRSGLVTDDELANGVRLASPQQAPSLKGADECVVEREQHARYRCRFSETGTADMGRDDYVRLVRLVERSSLGTVRVGATSPLVTKTEAFESRTATIDVKGLKSGITVEELFSRSKPIIFEVRLEGQEAQTPALLSEAPLPDLNAFQIIAAAVRIEQSPHADLRSPQSGAGSGPVTMENGSASRIAVYLSGPSTQRVLIAPHASAKVTALPGTYKVAAEATDGSATPLFAVQTYAGGERVQFYSPSK